jgi:hypothetical protein
MRGSVSAWAWAHFGGAAPDIRDAVVSAIPAAHRDAVTAQVGGRTPKKDPYGHTMKNRQHECLVEAAREIPGVQLFRPRGASFELVRLPETGVILFPWRYATDGRTPREKARMRTSGLRHDLLSGTASGMPGQLTIEHAELGDEELEARLAGDDAVVAQLREIARIVIIGYASDPSSIFELGWGDAELLDTSGTVSWSKWESLPVLKPATITADEVKGDLRVDRGTSWRVASSTPGRSAPDDRPRFDRVPVDDDLGLRPRAPLAGEPQQETGQQARDTGTEDQQP